jgi:hypothetical protein
MAKKKRSSSKREVVDTGRNKMFGKRGAKGRFTEMDDVGRSLSTDRRRAAKTATKSGYGDQGDRRTGAKRAAKGANRATKRGTTGAKRATKRASAGKRKKR